MSARQCATVQQHLYPEKIMTSTTRSMSKYVFSASHTGDLEAFVQKRTKCFVQKRTLVDSKRKTGNAHSRYYWVVRGVVTPDAVFLRHETSQEVKYQFLDLPPSTHGTDRLSEGSNLGINTRSSGFAQARKV